MNEDEHIVLKNKNQPLSKAILAVQITQIIYRQKGKKLNSSIKLFAILWQSPFTIAR